MGATMELIWNGLAWFGLVYWVMVALRAIYGWRGMDFRLDFDLDHPWAENMAHGHLRNVNGVDGGDFAHQMLRDAAFGKRIREAGQSLGELNWQVKVAEAITAGSRWRKAVEGLRRMEMQGNAVEQLTINNEQLTIEIPQENEAP